MTKLRSLGVAAMFLARCAVGGASSRFVVPPASAQQAASFPRWEYACFEAHKAEDVAPKANATGLQGWESAGVQGFGTGSV